ncbi:MAG TPA: site-specific integrase, partial [Chloroflexota bacterium]|nr:site-specific integrase [Chloroflexota bacterium]
MTTAATAAPRGGAKTIRRAGGDSSAVTTAAGATLIAREDTTQLPLATLEHFAGRARDYIKESRAENTRRAYRSDWNDFAAWCKSHGMTALPAAPETVALYLTDLAGRSKTSTLQRRLTAIAQAHQAAGHSPHESPTKHATVRAVWA